MRRLSFRWLLPVLLLGIAPHVPVDAQTISREDESLLAPVILAARAGKYDLATKRLQQLKAPKLLAKGTASLAVEYASNGNFEQSDKLLEEAKLLAEHGGMISMDRVSIFLHISKLEKGVERYEGDFEETFDRALSYVDKLSGISFDLALVEIAYASLEIFGDRQQTYELVSLIANEKMRSKLISALHLEDLAG